MIAGVVLYMSCQRDRHLKNRMNKGFLRNQIGRRETENKLNLLDGRMQREAGKNFQKENSKKVLTNERQHDIITKSLERATGYDKWTLKIEQHDKQKQELS